MRGVLTACSLQRDGARRKTGRSSAASQCGAGFISGESTSWKSVWSSAWSVFLSLLSHTDGGDIRSELTYLSWTMNALKKLQDSTGVWIITESWCLLRPPLHQDRSISMTSKKNFNINLLLHCVTVSVTGVNWHLKTLLSSDQQSNFSEFITYNLQMSFVEFSFLLFVAFPTSVIQKYW